MKFDDVARLALRLALQSQFLRLQILHSSAEGVRGETLDHQVDRTAQLGVDLGHALLNASDGVLPRGAQPLALGRVGLHRLGDHVLMQEVGFQRREDAILEHLRTDRPAVGAGRLRGGRRAAKAVDAARATCDDEVAVAGAAPDESGEEMLGRTAVRALRDATPGKLILDRLPRDLVHDPQVRHLDDLASGFAIRPRDPLAGVWIAKEALAVPDEAADIEFVAKDPIGPGLRALKGRLVPRTTARTGHVFSVQSRGDLARVTPVGGHGEDPLHHRRLFFRDLALAGAGELVAEAPPAGEATLAHATAETAVCLEREIAQEHGAHRALQADVHFRDASVRHRPDLDACEGHPLVEAGDVALIAREAVDILSEDDVDLAAARVSDEPLERKAAMDARARDGIVGVDVARRPARLPRGELPAQHDLILDRALVLQLGGEARVDAKLHDALWVSPSSRA
nr:hypothetical protein [Aureimonas pseudogalii]